MRAPDPGAGADRAVRLTRYHPRQSRRRMSRVRDRRRRRRASTGRPPTARCARSTASRSRSTQGTLNVLLGPSGCGKSTTLRLIAGLETADEGRSPIAGRDVTRLPPSQRNISMVFQSYALFPHLTVAENIVFGLRVRKVPQAECDRAAGASRRPARPDRAARPQAVAALGRPAAARGARPRDHRAGAGVPDGRAAVESRCAAARRDAPGDPRAAAQARHHDGVRDARPGRGDVDGRSRDPAATAAGSSRTARRSTSTRRRPTRSSRASSARRR